MWFFDDKIDFYIKPQNSIQFQFSSNDEFLNDLCKIFFKNPSIFLVGVSRLYVACMHLVSPAYLARISRLSSAHSEKLSVTTGKTSGGTQLFLRCTPGCNFRALPVTPLLTPLAHLLHTLGNRRQTLLDHFAIQALHQRGRHRWFWWFTAGNVKLVIN